MSFFADPDEYLEHNFQDHQVTDILYIYINMFQCCKDVLQCIAKVCYKGVCCTLDFVV